MRQKEFRELLHKRNEIIKTMTTIGESEEIKELVVKLEYKPVQSLSERYAYVKISQDEGNFEFFKKIAQILADNFRYSVQDSGDEYECCVYYGNDAYDFKFILSLARFYQNNQTLFDGHIDIIKRICESSNRHEWEDIKRFWEKYTINN